MTFCLHHTSQQPPLWLNSPLFSCLLPVLYVCFQWSFFIINQSVDQWIIICMLWCMYLFSLTCHKQEITAYWVRLCRSANKMRVSFFPPTETRAVTPVLRLWSCRVGFQPWSGRQRASTLCNKLHVIYLTLLYVVFNVKLNVCSAANQIAL